LNTKIKICGITRTEDALCAIELGADLLGFVFYKPSPRYIDPVDAGKIINIIGPLIINVGLFVNASKEEVILAIKDSGINCLQFHGHEDESFCKQFNLPYIKTILMKDNVDLLECHNNFLSAFALLLDTYSKNFKGGTGQKFDWKNINTKNFKLPIIVAGGLNKDNVNELIVNFKPYGVDISGGVEKEKGKKDYNMMKTFILGVRNAAL
jgi:phosphoribosylanthranilate isomerase